MYCNWLVFRPGLLGLVTSGGGGFTGPWGAWIADVTVDIFLLSLSLAVTAAATGRFYFFLYAPWTGLTSHFQGPTIQPRPNERKRTMCKYRYLLQVGMSSQQQKCLNSGSSPHLLHSLVTHFILITGTVQDPRDSGTAIPFKAWREPASFTGLVLAVSSSEGIFMQRKHIG